MANAFWAAVLRTGSVSLQDEGEEVPPFRTLVMGSGSGVGVTPGLIIGLGIVSKGPGILFPLGQHPEGVRYPVAGSITGAWKAGAFVGMGVLVGGDCLARGGSSSVCKSVWLVGWDGPEPE